MPAAILVALLADDAAARRGLPLEHLQAPSNVPAASQQLSNYETATRWARSSPQLQLDFTARRHGFWDEAGAPDVDADTVSVAIFWEYVTQHDLVPIGRVESDIFGGILGDKLFYNINVW